MFRTLVSDTCGQVLQDMLQLLKESVSSKHAERLEQIVIVLIGIEIGAWASQQLKNIFSILLTFLVLGIMTILVDLMASG